MSHLQLTNDNLHVTCNTAMVSTILSCTQIMVILSPVTGYLISSSTYSFTGHCPFIYRLSEKLEIERKRLDSELNCCFMYWRYCELISLPYFTVAPPLKTIKHCFQISCNWYVRSTIWIFSRNHQSEFHVFCHNNCMLMLHQIYGKKKFRERC